MPELGFLLLLASAFIAGIFDATVGGGGFVLIPHMAFSGIPIQMAIGTSRLIFLMDSLSALVGHALRRNIDYKIGTAYSIAAMAAAPVGAYVTATSNPENISRLFGLFMLVMLAVIARKPEFGMEDKRSIKLIPSLACGLVIGFMIGLLGGGVGVLIILALVFVSGMPMLLASGTSQLIVWTANIITLLAYYSSNLVDINLGLSLGASALVGAQFGVHIAHKVGNKGLRIALILLTLASGLKLVLG
jgi:uncharacterized membrane protein YfcA